MWDSLEIRTMLKQEVIIVMYKPMKSRNTAPRLHIDFGPGWFPQPNKSDIFPLKCWQLWVWGGSSCLLLVPGSKVTSSFRPEPAPASLPAMCPCCPSLSPSWGGGAREKISCEVGVWPRADALWWDWEQAWQKAELGSVDPRCQRKYS